MLYQVTIASNFLALVLAVWLGIFLVTRSPRSAIAWLTGLGLWSIAGLFLNVLVALNPPPVPDYYPTWIRLPFLFWPEDVIEQGSVAWLRGWTVVPAIVLWHHITTLMRGKLNAWRWTRILAGYAVGAAAVLVQEFTPLMYAKGGDNPLFLSALSAGPLYPYFGFFILIFSGASLINLIRAARDAPTSTQRKQLETLASVSLVTGLAGPFSIAGSLFGLPIPMLAVTLPLGVGVITIGYGVAKYSALMERRTVLYDFTYSAITMLIVVFLNLGVMWILVLSFDLPNISSLLIVLLAVLTHSLVLTAQPLWSKLARMPRAATLRENLRLLARVTGKLESLEHGLSLALDSICTSVRATFGLLLVFEDETPQLAATFHWPLETVFPNLKTLTADDVSPLAPGQLPSPLEEAALLVPLYAENQQIGALLLGRPENGLQFSNSDVEALLDPSDRIAAAIRDAQREAELLEQLEDISNQSAAAMVPTAAAVAPQELENALRNLFDYAYLGDTQLGQTRLVQQNLPEGGVTHLDRGKTVNQLVRTALDKLRPAGDPPREPIPREWHAYLILHDAYLENKPNRDIMGKLYISEGTFHRTRRSAVRAIARVLGEMDAAAG